MERRQFIKTAAAAAAAPLVPAGALSSAQVSPAIYGRALALISGGVYFTPQYLKNTLGLSDAAGHAVIDRLKAERLLGEVGKTGMMFSRSFYLEQAKIAARAVGASAARPGAAAAKPMDIVEKASDFAADALGADDAELELGDGAAADTLGAGDTSERN